MVVAVAFLPRRSYDEPYDDPTREREHGRAAVGDVPGPRSEHAAGKNDSDGVASSALMRQPEQMELLERSGRGIS